MWQKLKEQLPAIILTAILIIGAGYWVHTQTVAEMTAREEADLAPLREQNEALKASAEENRQTIEATNKLLKDAISKREADMFRTDEEIDKLNGERMDALAEAIAKKVQPYNPLPKSPEEAERMQNEQVDKVSSRMVVKITPILNEMASDQNLTRQSIDKYSQRISDQVGVALTGEMARNQQLNTNLQQTQMAADDALKRHHPPAHAPVRRHQGRLEHEHREQRRPREDRAGPRGQGERHREAPRRHRGAGAEELTGTAPPRRSGPGSAAGPRPACRG
jgi:hypothetical protein